MNNQILTIDDVAIMPVMDLQQAGMRRQAIVEFTKSIMVKGTDYGTVPGTGDKPTLLKPGAEKLTTFFGLSPGFGIVEKVLDWTGKDHDGEPFFFFQYRCELYRGDLLVGEGLGSCNSWEKKYRYRTAQLKCPNCEQGTIKRSKFAPRGRPDDEPGWYCFAKIGGCGAEFDFNHPAIQGQERGKVLNDNPADIVNTLDKMAQKRALVAATLIAINASEFFTQDVEDMEFDLMGVGEIIEEGKTPKGNGQKTTTKPKKAMNGTITRTNSNGAPKPGNIDGWRDKLAGTKNKTVGLIASMIAQAVPEYQGGADRAFEALKGKYEVPADWFEKGFSWTRSQRLRKGPALLLFDWGVVHAKNQIVEFENTHKQ